VSDPRDVIWRATRKPTRWSLLGLGTAAVGLAVLGVAFRGSVPGGPDLSERATVLCAAVASTLVVVGVSVLYAVTARVGADARGLRSRTALRRRSVSWHDVADLRVQLQRVKRGSWTELRRVSVLLRDGRTWRLPLLYGEAGDDPDFDATLEALRALHRRHGAPESRHLPVVSSRTAGRGWVGPLGLCVLLLAFAGLAASFVPASASQARAWRSATACTAQTPAAPRGECLTTLSAVIARTHAADGPSRSEHSWLSFAGGSLERVVVSEEAARAFRPGDRVALTVWRGTVRTVAGERHVWRAHVPDAGVEAAVAAACVLAAGYPGAVVLLRVRGRRLPDDEVLPSALPFAGALVGTAAWLLPLAYLYPTSLRTSPVAVTWAAAGSVVTLGLLAWARHATRVRTPAAAGAAGPAGTGEEVFVAARFLDDTEYNPYGFGTHVVLGGEPAVTPHAGPGRWAARRIPVERLTVTHIRRARGGDGRRVPGRWHVAEIDDAGTPVRLTAAPDDLVRIIETLGLARTPADTATPAR
jgi:hypothetical protein